MASTTSPTFSVASPASGPVHSAKHPICVVDSDDEEGASVEHKKPCVLPAEPAKRAKVVPVPDDTDLAVWTTTGPHTRSVYGAWGNRALGEGGACDEDCVLRFRSGGVFSLHHKPVNRIAHAKVGRSDPLAASHWTNFGVDCELSGTEDPEPGTRRKFVLHINPWAHDASFISGSATPTRVLFESDEDRPTQSFSASYSRVDGYGHTLVAKVAIEVNGTVVKPKVPLIVGRGTTLVVEFNGRTVSYCMAEAATLVAGYPESIPDFIFHPVRACSKDGTAGPCVQSFAFDYTFPRSCLLEE